MYLCFSGIEVDRIEKNLKTKHPEVRHVDLEVLWTRHVGAPPITCNAAKLENRDSASQWVALWYLAQLDASDEEKFENVSFKHSVLRYNSKSVSCSFSKEFLKHLMGQCVYKNVQSCTYFCRYSLLNAVYPSLNVSCTHHKEKQIRENLYYLFWRWPLFDPLFQMLNGCVRLIARVTSSSLACRRMSQSLADSPAFQVNIYFL